MKIYNFLATKLRWSNEWNVQPWMERRKSAKVVAHSHRTMYNSTCVLCIVYCELRCWSWITHFTLTRWLMRTHTSCKQQTGTTKQQIINYFEYTQCGVYRTQHNNLHRVYIFRYIFLTKNSISFPSLFVITKWNLQLLNENDTIAHSE